MNGLILFAHGARDPRWATPFEAVAARIGAMRPESKLQLAFLEFMSPTLPEAAARLVDAGCTQIQVLPLFLGTGGHLRRDLPLLMDTLCAEHPTATFTLRTAAGETASVIDALAAVAVAHIDTPAE